MRQVECRTGLARVAAELQAALSRRPDVNVQTCAWGSLSASENLRALSQEQPSLGMIDTSPGFLERCYRRCFDDGVEYSGLTGWISHRLGQAVNLVRDPLRGTSPTGFDVIHSTYARFPRAVRRSRTPTVITVHDLIPLLRPIAVVGKSQHAITRRIMKAIRPSDYVACVSEATRSDFIAYTGHPIDRTTVIPNGVDHAFFSPICDPAALREMRRRFGLGEHPFVLTTSSLATHKNLATVMEAWRAIRGRPEGKLVIAGGRLASADASRRQLNIAATDHSVVVTGFVTDAEFRALASGCNAFLFPSLHEGFGLPVLEAMAMGAPVIASNATSLPEVVGDAGMLLGPREVDAWRDAITSALARPARTLPHESSLARARLFSWDRTAAAYVDLYRRAKHEAA